MLKPVKLTEDMKVCALIEDAGAMRKALDRKAKAKFAYKYSNITDLSFEDIYKMAVKNFREHHDKKYVRSLYLFSSHQKLRRFVSNADGYSDLYAVPVSGPAVESFCKDLHSNHFLSQFDIEETYKTDNLKKQPIFQSFLTKGGKTVKIDKAASSNIVLVLEEKGIATLKGIVEGAYPYYANGELDEYVNELKSTSISKKLVK